MHGLAQVFAPVGGDDNQPGAGGPAQQGVAVVLPHRGLQGVDGRVAGDHNALGPLALRQKVCFAPPGGGKVQVRHAAHKLAVHLLGVGGVFVVGAQAGLDMAHGGLAVVGG